MPRPIFSGLLLEAPIITDLIRVFLGAVLQGTRSRTHRPRLHRRGLTTRRRSNHLRGTRATLTTASNPTAIRRRRVGITITVTTTITTTITIIMVTTTTTTKMMTAALAS